MTPTILEGEVVPSTAQGSVTARLDSKRALDALLAADGSIGYACEILGTPSEPIPQEELVKALADNPGELIRTLRIFSILETHDLRRKLKLVFEGSLSDLEPKEAAKAYTDLTDQMERFTAPPKTNGDFNLSLVFDNMPREAADTVKRITMIDPQQREELRRIAQARRVGPNHADDGEL